jgi:hypothetical protein
MQSYWKNGNMAWMVDYQNPPFSIAWQNFQAFHAYYQTQ